MWASTKTIRVDYLARVEGEGSLLVKIQDGKVQEVKFKIFEPPRFFEALLRGRMFSEAPDITARICGICPVAYQMSSVHAMENAFGVRVDGPLRDLRRLLYCGEWIESHALHIFLLHAPDFLGYEDAIGMAKDHPDIVQMGLRLKKIGNELVTLLGGREIHPINVRVGGFYKVPAKKDFAAVAEDLRWAQDAARKTVQWAGKLSFPDFHRDYECVALVHPQEYPLNEGRLASNKGLDIAIGDYEQHFAEEHVEHSNALHSFIRRGRDLGNGDLQEGDRAYLVGPLARYNLNFQRLSKQAQEAARAAGLGPVCNNPFQSIIVRAVETLYACEEALRIIGQYEMPDRPAVEIQPRAGKGYGCTEAPRGILYHRYTLDNQGIILDAKIVPPTAQNQKIIEEDLRDLVTARCDWPQKKLTWECEQAIRNYDPCISCATHFLKLEIQRVKRGQTPSLRDEVRCAGHG